MSILIKGMEMPKDGAFVEVLIWSDGHVTQTGDSYFAEDGRAYYQPCDWKYFSSVPVPPHGRLIDGDVAEVITYTNESGDFSDGILYAADWIASQPTVIEADDTIKTPLFDIVEEHDHCHVQVLRNSITGEISVGWWEEKE